MPLITLGNKWEFKSLLIIGQLIKPKAMKLEGEADDYLKPRLFCLIITPFTCMPAAGQKVRGRRIRRADLDLASVDQKSQGSSPPSPG